MFQGEPIIPTEWQIGEESLIAKGKKPTFIATAIETGRLLLGIEPQSEVLTELPAPAEQPRPLFHEQQ